MSADIHETEELFLGYRLRITSARSDGTYHDRADVHIDICAESSDNVLHVIVRSNRSTHQLSKRYRSATDPRESAIIEAQQWILANRADAVTRQEAEHEERRVESKQWRQRNYEEVGRDPVAYVLGLPHTLSTTDVGRVLELGSARKVNRMLLEWGLQHRAHNTYAPVDAAHGEQVGFYGTPRWRITGLKAIWDTAVTRGVVSGGDAEFVRCVRMHTDWFDGVEDSD